MNNWLGIALMAYLVGATIEGLAAASELSRSSLNIDRIHNDADSASSGKWQVLTAITTVSICGGMLWPCRLFHRALKSARDQQDQ